MTNNVNEWKTLISTLTNLIENNESYNLEVILKMIKQSLTFEDPGILPSKVLLSAEDRLQATGCNMWLLNKLVHILCDSKFLRTFNQNLELQKDILSASLLKQPWLFNIIVDKYIIFTNLLINAKLPLQSPMEIDIFNENKFNLKNIEANCRYTVVVVHSEDVYKVVTFNIQLLTHVISLITDSDPELETKCTDCVLNTLNKMPFNINILCLEYFCELFQNLTTMESEKMKEIFISVLFAINSMLEQLTIWTVNQNISMALIEKLNLTLISWFTDLKRFDYYKNSEENQLILQILTKIIKNYYLNRSSDKFIKKSTGDSILEYYKYLLNILPLQETNYDDLKSLIPDLSLYPEVSGLLEYCVVQEVIENNETSNVLKSSKTLQQIYLILQQQFINYDTCHQENLCINKLFFILQQIMLVTVRIECKLQSKNKIISVLGEDITYVGMEFNKIVMAAVRDDFDDFSIIIEIAKYLYFLRDFGNLNKNIQQFIVEILTSPYIEIIKEKCLTNVTQEYKETIQQKMKNDGEKLELQMQSLKILSSRSIDNLSYFIVEKLKASISIILKYLNTCHETIKELIIISAAELIANQLQSLGNIMTHILEPAMKNESLHSAIAQSLKKLICVLYGDCKIVRIEKNNEFSCEIYCCQCENNVFNLYEPSCRKFKNSECDDNFLDLFLILFQSTNNNIKFNMIQAIPSFVNHQPEKLQNIELWKHFFTDESTHIKNAFADILPALIKCIYAIEDNEKKQAVIRICLEQILVAIKTSLNESKMQNQSSIINIINKVALCPEISEETFLHCFKMMFFFIIRTESCVVSETFLIATEICAKRNVLPLNMLNWYRQPILKLIISLSVCIYMKDSIGLYNSLSNPAKLLGFNGPRDFIHKHFKLILAMLLPWCINFPKCKQLLGDVCNVIQKDLSDALSISFLTIYPYLFLNESADVNNQCIDFIIQNTSRTLYRLLHTDIKRTIAEILIFYHKSPDCVMHAFRSLLTKDDATKNSMEISLSNMKQYISTRFLGVLTFFEATLINVESEKCIKRETLLSLGDIMRLMGSSHITPFRFKILSMLRTALSLEEADLMPICAKIWTIFIHTVDVQSLGPLLSTIFVSLEPLLQFQPDDVNEIFKYLVVSNGSLMSCYITDLFFIEDTNVCREVKAVISSQMKRIKEFGKFSNQLDIFKNHINHENLGVRIYGLNYLTKLFASNRKLVNNLVIGPSVINPTLESALDTLILGCKHIDEHLQIASSICLGELGAIEPSHLPPNYAPQQNFALSIHTDAFAIMALAELCRAYQFQKNTEYVDCFSLAIQEILQARGVCPKSNRKMEVWEAIPERMRQLMEPLLTSCYTGLQMNVKENVHPVFGSSKCQSSEQWAFVWASNMIEKIQDEGTKHLLNSFKPSIKHDFHTLSMFLPYIILHALQSSSEENCLLIKEELQTVFSVMATINDQDDRALTLNQTRKRGLKTIYFVPMKMNQMSETTIDMQIKCVKLAFNQLDFLDNWMRQWPKIYSVSSMTDNNYITIQNFMKQFDKKMIAKANFNCGEYARALQYIEQYIIENPEKLQEELSFLAEIYAELMDPDSLEGAMALKISKLELSEQILMHNVTGRLTESAACFERMMQVGDISIIHMKDIVQCYLGLDQLETALLVSEGLLNQMYDKNVNCILEETRAEPLWRLGRFEELEDLINNNQLEESPNWGVRCGQILLNFRKGDVDQFQQQIEKTRRCILKSLKSAGIEQNAYQKGYSLVLKLHLITEIEKANEIVYKVKNANKDEFHEIMENFFTEWDARLELLQPTAKVVEPVLCLRRILLNETKSLINQNQNSEILTEIIDEQIGKLWIKSTELATKAGLFQQAHLYIMNCENYKLNNLFIEKAKLLWKKGNQSNTFQVLYRGLDEILQGAGAADFKKLSKDNRKLYAEAKLMIANYNAESMNIDTDLNIRYFKEALQAYPESEKSYVCLAQFLDRIYSSLSDDQQQTVRGAEMLQDIMNFYGKSMQYGCNYLYQSMPRMLSIWLDFTAKMRRDETHKRASGNMNKLAERFSETLPTFMFFTAFSQLVSRICHPSHEVYSVLKTILVKLICDFPQQSLWMILSVFKSSLASRVKRCTEVLSDKRLSNPDMQKLIQDFNTLAEKLIELTNKEITIPKPTVSVLVPSLPRLFQDYKFSQIVIPAQKFMLPEIPAAGDRDRPAGSFVAFPKTLAFIQGIREEVTVLQSLQKPRRVTLLANDGIEYIVMTKPRDDLRKDFRLMEFNAIVKRYLHQDTEARERRLNIRTYAVLPLNEECGIIEWVPNLQTLRQILLTIYKQNGKGLTMRELKELSCKPTDPLAKKRDIFENKLKIRHPPVFADWLKDRFTTPYNWYQARMACTRTTAVMSIVGYILGLGDRHGENILYDATTGDAVHVDFNCLFNKGETFEFPEKVPFRLTHNMVHAMGPLGTEGLFRKCCEVTLKILQAQTPTLMSVLRPFVYDPLVAWSKISSKNDGNVERTDAQAMSNVKHIEERLKGFVKIKGKTSNMPLSAEGQVNFVISEATDVNNLAEMYVGWGGFM